ncbi:hypothetical protein OpiT1DRAFT_05303 [Opitutaceae bacterium TAV1]|nr:hypothetical protein OpiT1DRAFT_05303 [Opitutaceae bacterium TAV1]
MPATIQIQRPTFGINDALPPATFNSVTVLAGTVPDATGSTEGVIRLAGDLTGSAENPQLANSGVTAGEYGKAALKVPQITVDAKGRLVAVADRDLPISEAAAEGLNAATGEARWAAFGFDTAALSAIIYKQVMQLQYPVGEVCITRRAGNPATWLGFGTWVIHGAGRMMVAHNPDDADFSTIDKTGGSKTHTLAVGQLPVHNVTIPAQNVTTAGAGTHRHKMYLNKDDGGSSGDCYRFGGTADRAFAGDNLAGTMEDQNGKGTWLIDEAGNHTHTLAIPQHTSSNVGSGNAVNHLPPYQVYFVWRRTA